MKQSLKRRFIEECFDGDYTAYLRARKEDYCEVQFEWSCWLDLLCKNGEITQAQFDRETF